MEFEAISATRMIALMLIGGSFSFAGLYMMLRPRPEGAAKIELFGLKFESSSAGLLVFLVGAAFLSVTLFVPERQTSIDQTDDTPKTEAPSDGPQAVSPVDTDQISEDAIIGENEPNDTIRDAQQLRVGQIAAEAFKDQAGDKDWYSISFDGNSIAEHEIRLRHVNGNIVFATVYDLRNQEIGKLSTQSGTAYYSLEDQTTPQIFIQVSGAIGGWDTDTYEVSIEPK